MKIKITETVLRDANQSLAATRLRLADFEEVLPQMDAAGYASLECWGGATFDACLRYLDEDPWERLRAIRSKVKKTKLQMLLRGQNILGYRHYPDDVVRAFVTKSIENGIDIVRIFDALNDLRNIETAVEACLKAGGEAQGTICYTISPIHNLENFVKLGKEIESMGCQSLCIKDMAGILSPKAAFDLVTALKAEIKLPIIVHTHCTTGLGPMTYLKAVEAGASAIDCALSSFSGGTAQPATEAMVYALDQMGCDCGVKLPAVKKLNDFFAPIAERFIEDGTLNTYVLGTKADALSYQVPGGMLSNLISQLKNQNALDRLEEVLEETPRVRADLGYPPLVTPMSQMVGVQAATNVLTGKRYGNISTEIKNYLRGEYGRAPGEISEELKRLVLGDEEPMEGRYADTLPDGLPAARKAIGKLARCEEDVLSYIAFPQQAEAFLKNRQERAALKVKYTIREA